MTIEIRQNLHGNAECDYCPHVMCVGELFLYSRGIGKCYYRCKSCAVGRYGYRHEDFRTFRPDSLRVLEKINDLDSWRKIKINMELLV